MGLNRFPKAAMFLKKEVKFRSGHRGVTPIQPVVDVGREVPWLALRGGVRFNLVVQSLVDFAKPHPVVVLVVAPDEAQHRVPATAAGASLKGYVDGL